MLISQSIEKYRAIYCRQFGEEISHEEAAQQALRLLNLARVVFQPMPKKWLDRYNQLLQEREALERSADSRPLDVPRPEEGYQTRIRRVQDSNL